MKYAYKPGDKIITWEGHKGVIESLQVSRIDNQDIPSYWVIYNKSIYPDGFARNTWESSIRCSDTEVNCKNCKEDNCCFLAFICIPFNHKFFKKS